MTSIDVNIFDDSGPLAKVWDAATGEELLTYEGHYESERIWFLAISPDGERVATAGNIIKVWERATVQVYTSPSGPFYHVALTPDGKYLVASGAGFVYGFILDQEELVNLSHSRITRWFKPEECQQYLHRETCPEPPFGRPFSVQAPQD